MTNESPADGHGMASKRSRSSPIGIGFTPRQREKRQNRQGCIESASAKKLSFATTASWSAVEERALVEYVMGKGFVASWPHTKRTEFWENAAKYLQERCKSAKRTSGGCRARVVMKLRRRFNSPQVAIGSFQEFDLVEGAMNVPAGSSYSPLTIESTVNVPAGDCTPSSGGSIEISKSDPLFEHIASLSGEEQVDLISELLTLCASQQYGLSVPVDFIKLSLCGMQRLNDAGRFNVIYGLAKGLGTDRPDGSGPCFPTSRMPMGLLQYIVQFFITEPGHHVPCPDDYQAWLQTNYVLFGTRWSKLYCGPLGSVEATEQGSSRTPGIFNPLTARVNVPAPVERTLRRGIAASAFSTQSNIQVETLDEAHRILPGAKWWIKADGCDVIPSLEESVQLEWHGDVDLGDGKCQTLHQEYVDRLRALTHLTSNVFDHESRQQTLYLLQKQEHDISNDLLFLHECLDTANQDYCQKLASKETQSKTLFNLGWKVDELSRLNKDGRCLSVEVHKLMELLGEKDCDLVSGNVAKRLSTLSTSLTTFLKGLYHHKRTAATHVLAILISPEARSRKPYALPVQLIPYAGLGQTQIRDILNNIIRQMTVRGMDVSGFVANGEYNVLRSNGYTRPLSVFKVRADTRGKYAKMGKKKMLRMINPINNCNGVMVAEEPNLIVPQEVLREVWQFKRVEGLSDVDVVDRLRARTVPAGYPIHNWRKGEDETFGDKLRSVLAQMEFKYIIRSWDSKGVPFQTYMYVPEIHPILSKEFHEREDEGHVFKRIGQSTRQGGPSCLKLERFTEALYEDSTQLTFPALTGQRKQSIRDVENLFSVGMEKFMESKGYQYEAKYIRTIRNWRRSCDERGLNSLQRSRFNYQMLQLILDELMPWHRTNYDFSLMEVNHPVDGVLGFTRETVIALTTNIESREWKRREYANLGHVQEHPRASSTDDVECLFSIMRDLAGKHFTVRTASYNWRKVCLEFSKRLDPDLGFYYHTSSHDRFYEGERPSFDIQASGKSSRNPRNQRVRRRDQLSQMVFGRVTLPTPGARSVRMQYHNVPVELPPPPSTYHPLSEHAYTRK